MRRAIAIAAAALVLVSCGSPEEERIAGGAATPTPGPASPAPTEPNVASTIDPEQPVSNTPGGPPQSAPPQRTHEPGRRLEPAAWYLLDVTNGGRTLRLGYTMSGIASDCQRPGGVKVEENASNVTVTVYRSIATTEQACTEELGYFEAVAKLDAPLGDRNLLGCAPNAEGVPDDNPHCRDTQRARDAGFPGA